MQTSMCFLMIVMLMRKGRLNNSWQLHDAFAVCGTEALKYYSPSSESSSAHSASSISGDKPTKTYGI